MCKDTSIEVLHRFAILNTLLKTVPPSFMFPFYNIDGWGILSSRIREVPLFRHRGTQSTNFESFGLQLCT